MSIRHSIKRFGLARALIAAALERLERHLGLHVWAIGLRTIRADFEIPPKHAAGFEFRLASLQELVDAGQDPKFGLTKNFVNQALGRGEFCQAAFADGRLVAYTWRSYTSARGPDGTWLRIRRPRTVYGYKTYVHPESRGQRLNATLVRCYDAKLFEQGIRQDLGYVALHNLSSMTAYFRDRRHRLIGYVVCAAWGRFAFSLRTRDVRQAISIAHCPPSRKAKSAKERTELTIGR
jgi:GNAT superfamily N-acetyltransferase